MNFTRNLRYYPLYTVFFIIIFFFTLFISTAVPIWIDNQQQTLINTQINTVPYDLHLTRQGILQDSHTDTLLQQLPAVKSAFVVENIHSFETIIMNNINDFKPNNTYIYNSSSVIAGGFVILSLSNNTFTDLKNTGDINFSRPLQGNELVIDSYSSIEFHLSVGEKILLSLGQRVEQNNQFFSITSNISSFDIVGIIPDQNENLQTITGITYIQPPSLKFFTPIFITSNEKFKQISVGSGLLNTNNYYDLSTNFYVFYNLTRPGLLDKTNIPQSIQNIDLLNQQLSTLLGTNAYSAISPLIDRLTNIYNLISNLQIFFLIILIPSLIITIIIIKYIADAWIEVRKTELFVFYSRGNDTKAITRQIQHDLFQFAIVSFLGGEILEYFLLLLLQWDISNGLLLYNIMGLLFLGLFYVYLTKRGLKITPKMVKSFEEKDKVVENSSHQHDDFWNLKTRHYIIIFLGLIPLLFQVLNFLAIEYNGLFSSFQSFVSPYIPILVIFSPIFSLYGGTLVIFFIIHKIFPKIKPKLPIIFKSNFFDDLARNKREIFQMFLLFTVGFALTLGPVFANDSINAQDQQQLHAYYGTDYSTGFVTQTLNYTLIKDQLASIKNLQWAVLLKTTGMVYFTGAGVPALIFMISANYFNVVTYSGISQNKILQFTQAATSAFYTQIPSNYNSLIPDNEIPNVLNVDYDNNMLPSTNVINIGSFSYLPGGYIGPYGYVGSYGGYSYLGSNTAYGTDNYDYATFVVVTHLPNTYQLISSSSNFLFNINQENKTPIISQLEHILGVPIHSNIDPTTHKYLYPSNANISGAYILGIRSQSIDFLGLLNIVLLILFILIFIQKYLFQRKYELGIFRARGYSKCQIYRLICSQILLVIIAGTAWALFNSILYSMTIATDAIQNKLIPITFYISTTTSIVVVSIILLFVLLTLTRTVELFKHTILDFLNRSV